MSRGANKTVSWFLEQLIKNPEQVVKIEVTLDEGGSFSVDGRSARDTATDLMRMVTVVGLLGLSAAAQKAQDDKPSDEDDTPPPPVTRPPQGNVATLREMMKKKAQEQEDE